MNNDLVLGTLQEQQPILEEFLELLELPEPFRVNGLNGKTKWLVEVIDLILAVAHSSHRDSRGFRTIPAVRILNGFA